MEIIKSASKQLAATTWRVAEQDEYISASGMEQRMAIYDHPDQDLIVYAAFGDDRLDIGVVNTMTSQSEYVDMDFNKDPTKINSAKLKAIFAKYKVPMIDASLLLWVVTGIDEKLFTKL